MSAFAVFCATDGSLTFYNRDAVPAVGSTFEGKVVSNVYTGVDTDSYSYNETPWNTERASILSVSFVDEIVPVSTAAWFFGCGSLSSIDFTNLNTSNVTTMRYMFVGCSKLASIDLSGFNTSNVEYMDDMFQNCESLKSLNVSNFNTSKVKNMAFMFYNCRNLTTLNLSNFNTSNVTSLNGTFNGCRKLTSLDVSSFDTSKVNNLFNTFQNCSSLTSLDISNFDTQKVTNMKWLFNGCSNLKTIYVSKYWSTKSVTESTEMFKDCTKLVGAISYDSTKIDATYANYITGYLTEKFVQMLIKDITLYDLADKIRILSDSKENMIPSKMVTILSNIRDAKEVQF